jgi:murein DD-endopeptidase MepM/ murein hydrolase activator NlpD
MSLFWLLFVVVGMTIVRRPGSSSTGPLDVVPSASRPLVLPVDGRISSEFGPRGPPLNDFHNGIDFAVPAGTPILMPGTGVVTVSTEDELNGNYVIVDVQVAPGRTLTFGFAHMSVRHVAKGDQVEQGAELGLSGFTGKVYPPGPQGAHVHMTVRVNHAPSSGLNPRDVPEVATLLPGGNFA